MANETTLKVKASPDGKSCVVEIVEEEAKTGDRIDQKAAQMIVQMDEMLRNPEFLQRLGAMSQQMQMLSGQQMRFNQPQMPFGAMPMNPGFPGGGMNWNGGMGGHGSSY